MFFPYIWNIHKEVQWKILSFWLFKSCGRLEEAWAVLVQLHFQIPSNHWIISTIPVQQIFEASHPSFMNCDMKKWLIVLENESKNSSFAFHSTFVSFKVSFNSYNNKFFFKISLLKVFYYIYKFGLVDIFFFFSFQCLLMIKKLEFNFNLIYKVFSGKFTLKWACGLTGRSLLFERFS